MQNVYCIVAIDLDPVERSIVEQYEHRLAAKRQEVIELQRQRDELRKTHARLVLLQSQILTPKVCVCVCVCVWRERERELCCVLKMHSHTLTSGRKCRSGVKA